MLGWPHPVLIGWDLKPGEDSPNGDVSHLFKIFRTLDYFNSIPRERDNDLVLLIDAYDVWFQLRPDVLIQRYHSMRDAANQRLVDELGASVVAKNGLRQTIFFNADKTLWPNLDTSTNMWWLPNSTLPEYAFGPLTDISDHTTARPRWLNSGAIIGPIGDMRRLFNATAHRVNKEILETLFSDSDQMWFSKIYADQEYARMLLRSNQSLVEEHAEDMAFLTPDQETEYHISLDYQSDLFLANAFYHNYLGWLPFETPKKRPKNQAMLAPYQIDLPPDVLSSPPPFAAVDSARDHNNFQVDPYIQSLVADATWRNLILGTNLVTGQVFPLLHMTGDKSFRHTWWDRMWFYPFGHALLSATSVAPRNKIITKTSDGCTWRVAEGTPNSTEKSMSSTVGAWSDMGRWLPWSGEDGICEVYEDYLFGKLPPEVPEELDVELEAKLDRIYHPEGEAPPQDQHGRPAEESQPPSDKPDAGEKPPLEKGKEKSEEKSKEKTDLHPAPDGSPPEAEPSKVDPPKEEQQKGEQPQDSTEKKSEPKPDAPRSPDDNAQDQKQSEKNP